LLPFSTSQFPPLPPIPLGRLARTTSCAHSTWWCKKTVVTQISTGDTGVIQDFKRCKQGFANIYFPKMNTTVQIYRTDLRQGDPWEYGTLLEERFGAELKS